MCYVFSREKLQACFKAKNALIFQYKNKHFEWISQAFFIENQRLLNPPFVQVRNGIELLYFKTLTNPFGRHTFSRPTAPENRGAISFSRNPAMPQPMRVT